MAMAVPNRNYELKKDKHLLNLLLFVPIISNLLKAENKKKIFTLPPLGLYRPGRWHCSPHQLRHWPWKFITDEGLNLNTCSELLSCYTLLALSCLPSYDNLILEAYPVLSTPPLH
jgi:hypothetical protein